MKLMAVVVLYHPQPTVIDNIKTYLDDVDQLLVLDNSEKAQEKGSMAQACSALPHSRYVAFGDNMGMAYALNYALQLANSYDYLLTMDQDSSFPTGMVQRYKETVNHFPDKTVAMFGGNYDHKTSDKPFKYEKKIITSGAMLNVSMAKELGGFDEQLFIDEVDSEFCYRARQHGQKIVMLYDIQFDHELGELKEEINIFGNKKMCVGCHEPLRMYYIMRNKVYVMKRYPQVIFPYLCYFKSRLRSLFLGYQYKRAETRRMILRGIKDGVLNHMGKYGHL